MDNGAILKRLLLLTAVSLLLLSAVCTAAPTGPENGHGHGKIAVAKPTPDDPGTKAQNVHFKVTSEEVNNHDGTNDSESIESDESVEVASSRKSIVDESSESDGQSCGDNMFVLSFEKYNATLNSDEETSAEDEDNFVIRLTRALKNINFGRLPKTIVLNQKEVIEHTHIDEEKFILPQDKGGFVDNKLGPKPHHEPPHQYLPPAEFPPGFRGPFPVIPSRYRSPAKPASSSVEIRGSPVSFASSEAGYCKPTKVIIQSLKCKSHC